MSTQTCTAVIRGIPNIPTVTEVNVRSVPSVTGQLLFKIPVGTRDLTVLEAQPDTGGAKLNGKVYQWFRLNFSNGQSGWVRDDLIEIVGDCVRYGYGVLANPTYAFDIVRNQVVTAPPPTPPTSGNTAPIPEDTRVLRAAFAVTAAFEGKGYTAYQNYDRGIVSYGRFQFALTGGLGTVLTRYLQRCNDEIAVQLRPYQPRVMAVDESLRHDTRFRDLLIAAAANPVMQDIQNEVAKENYWDRVMNLSLISRGLQSPLARAMLFDIGIQYGVMHSLLGLAEGDLGVPPRSRVGTNGIIEQQLIAAVAERRRRGLYAQAERENLPGLKRRADFWVNLIQANDWGFMGDANGNVNVNGKIIQVRTPAER
ncbi:MAG: SH3 domain-containing protein [Anaerolineae bacterium]|jgi:hypothetical protein|nr:SH3 domain-containing protein [Anaerolineae bacterium]